MKVNGHHHSEPPDFPLDEPPTMPTRSRSGKPIKARVIQAMARQHEAARKASEALDALVVTLRRAVESGSNPPPSDEEPARAR